MRVAWAAVVAIAAVACGTDDGGGGDDDGRDKTAACAVELGLGEARSAVTVQDRRVIGAAAAYAPDLALASRDDELAGSIAARRAAAWRVVAQVLAPVPLGDPRLADSFGGAQPVVPAWATWYARDDLDRVFKYLYRGLGPAGRAVRAPLDVDAGLAWNATALDGDPAWPEARYLEYLAAIDSADEANGVGGISRVGYSPGAARGLVGSYAAQHACRLVDEPPAYASDPMTTGARVAETEAVAVAACGWRVFGPYQAGADVVAVTARGNGDADVYVRRGAPPTTTAWDCRSQGPRSDEACEVDGDGPVYVAVFGAAAAEVELEVAYLAADVARPACLAAPLPRDAVLVKADWRRQLPGTLLPIFSSSGPRMTARFAAESVWNPDGQADPQPADIYTVQLQTGARFRLPALHVMTKELDHWLWITLWWSPQPDEDFGADRPAAVAALGPWRNYKMCVSTSYVEGDPDPRGGAPGSLGDALAAVHAGVGGPTWCSNPYLEQGPGNAATNCIGCHQHGGTTLTAERILAEQPHFGATRVRNNFFTDYLWAVKGGSGEDLSALIQAEVDYWDAND